MLCFSLEHLPKYIRIHIGYDDVIVFLHKSTEHCFENTRRRNQHKFVGFDRLWFICNKYFSLVTFVNLLITLRLLRTHTPKFGNIYSLSYAERRIILLTGVFSTKFCLCDRGRHFLKICATVNII